MTGHGPAPVLSSYSAILHTEGLGKLQPTGRRARKPRQNATCGQRAAQTRTTQRHPTSLSCPGREDPTFRMVVPPPKLHSSLTKRSNVSQQPKPSVVVNTWVSHRAKVADQRCLVASKASYGWVVKSPLKTLAQELDQKARKASRPLVQDSICLQNLLEGGATCLESVVGTRQVLLWLKRKCQERWTPFHFRNKPAQ